MAQSEAFEEEQWNLNPQSVPTRHDNLYLQKAGNLLYGAVRYGDNHLTNHIPQSNKATVTTT